MPGDMPYYLEKGPYLTQIEIYCSDKENSVTVLEMLRAGAEIPEIGAVLEAAAAQGGPSAADLKAHIYRDWFGRKPDTSEPSGWGAQPPFHATNNPTTGYWQMYYGDVEAILRETLIRALEVSLGLQHNQEVPANGPPRHWPIEFWWKCGQGWWEGWVTWRNDQHKVPTPSADAGQVTVMFATPGSGHGVLENPAGGQPGLKVDPQNTRVPGGNERFQGSWVVTHTKQAPRFAMTTVGGSFSRIILPTIGVAYKGEPGVVVVQPSWPDGGTKE